MLPAKDAAEHRWPGGLHNSCAEKGAAPERADVVSRKR